MRRSWTRRGLRLRLRCYPQHLPPCWAPWPPMSLSAQGGFGADIVSGMIYAPLVMPEVITGLSLLLLFIGIGLDRGVMTIVLAHTTFSMCYVSVVVSSRLATFEMSLEEAALDLGSTPFEAFRLVTLPIIAPAVISGWLLAFTLSLDDLVIASFTSGPSATTLPIKIFSAVRLGSVQKSMRCQRS